MKHFWAICLSMFVVSQGACQSNSSQETPVQTMEIVSFNLRYNTAADSANAWPHRLEAVRAMIEEADIVGVQEALPNMLFDLDDGLIGFGRAGTGRNADGGGEHTAILFRMDRFELLDSDTFWLSETPDVPGSRGWDAALPRIATWARFHDRHTQQSFTVLNTHFDHRGEVARQESARLLTTWIDERGDEEPVLLTGDFNVAEDSEVYRILTEGTGLFDARLISEEPATGIPGTWNDFGRAFPWHRLDYVFVTEGVGVQTFTTWDQTMGDVLGTNSVRFPSDHFPVAATVLLGND